MPSASDIDGRFPDHDWLRGTSGNLSAVLSRDPRVPAVDVKVVRRGRPFFAEFDPKASWITDLRPAFADSFPFEQSR